MILWREKWIAFAVHFVVTVALALAAAALIFLVWYPDPFHIMLGGTTLFLLVAGCDLALGPLLSLVIYNSRKSRRQLVFDYSCVGLVQLGALIYGVYIVSDSRPAYIAFVGDRYEIVAAGDLSDADLAAAKDPVFRRRPLWGPELVATVVPPENRNEVLFSGLNGKDVQFMPRFYVPYESRLEPIRKRAQPLSTLTEKKPDAIPLIAEAQAAAGNRKLRWLTVHHTRGFWTALVDASTGLPVSYLPIDPYS